MNFGQIKSRVNELTKVDGWSSAVASLDLGSVVNRALREFSWEAEYVRENLDFVTVAGTTSYSLTSPPDWKYVFQVLYGGATELRRVDEATLSRESPLWLVADASTPTAFLFNSPNSVQLYPTPDTSDVSVLLRGVRPDALLSAESDSPVCPDHFCEGIALLAAWHIGKQYATGDEYERAQAYYNEAQGYMGRLKESFKAQGATILQRRVSFGDVERVSLG